MHRQKKRGAKKKISKEIIYKAAINIVDIDGFNALSMRKIADEIGVGTMTLYGYVKNRDELISRTIEYYLQEYNFSPKGSQENTNYRDNLISIFLELHHMSIEHSGAFELLLSTRSPNPTFTRLWESALDLLIEGGVPDEEAFDICLALTNYVIGFTITKKLRHGFTDKNAKKFHVVKLDPKEYPLLNKLEKVRASGMSESSFLMGLNKFLDGIFKS